jgi:hypothetical protein
MFEFIADGTEKVRVAFVLVLYRVLRTSATHPLVEMGFFLPSRGISNQIQSHNDLYEAAVTYLQQHFVVIPTHANKVAAVNWKFYQSHLPTVRNLRSWFLDFGNPSIAIVCGAISRLIVLDFDTEAAFERFKAEHPDLTDTLTIGTRRGYHLWLHIPSDVVIKSRKGQGVDLLAEGKYAIAPPSTINGHTYTIERALPILELTQDDIQRITTFVGGEVITPEPEDSEAALPLSTPELLGLYRAHAHVGNRNNALFYTALAARDSGWSCANTIAALADVHTAASTAGENAISRYREAVRTIESAFSRPPRLRTTPTTSQLPNTLREKLNSLGLTCVIRVIEAIWRLGYQPSDLVHPEILWQELDGLIGRHSVYKALKATLKDGSTLFEPVVGYEMVSPRTSSSEASASQRSTDPNNMLLSATKNRHKPPDGGRPTISYCTPSINDISQWLSVPASRTSDELPNEKLNSAKNTRKQLHDGILRRRPGRYGRDLLAKRVGVCVRTIDTYNAELKTTYADFNVRHCYLETPLFWNNLDKIPPEDALPNGVFLLDDTGKRYPAKKSIAIMLLKCKRKVRLMRQGFNEYWFGSRFHPPSLVEQPRKVEAAPEMQPEMWRSNAALYFKGLSDALEAHNRAKPTLPGDLATRREDGSLESKTIENRPRNVTKPKERPHNPKRPFPYAEDEELVERLQQRINKLCQDPNHRISKKNMRQLMITYGKSVVKQAVKDVEAKDYIDQNPVGFLITKLRSDSKQDDLKLLLDDLKRNGRGGF